jgi:uncharacterized membrane protein
MKKNSLIKDQALTALDGHWLKSACIVCVLLLLFEAFFLSPYYLVTKVSWVFVLCYLLGIFVVTILMLPLMFGYWNIFLDVTRGGGAKFSRLLSGFRDYKRVWTTMMLEGIYIWLWTMLFYIPGIIKSYSYAMVPYILRDYPQMRNNEVINLSMRMMRGHKMKLFLLHLSFIGWFFLCIITLGIGYFFLVPYMATAQAAFYDNLKQELGMKTAAEAAAATPDNVTAE